MSKAIPLEGGLDLRNPVALIQPGKLSACLNYETRTDVKGYKIMDGFERHDGRMSPGSTDMWGIIVPNADDPTDFLPQSALLANGTEIGVIITHITHSPTHKIIVFLYWPEAETLETGDILTSGSGTLTLSVTTVVKHLTDAYPGAEQFMLKHSQFQTGSVYSIQPVPGDGPILGSKRFNGDTYAIRNLYKFGFTNGGITEPVLHQRILSASNKEGIISAIDATGGEWEDGNKTGTITACPYDYGFTFNAESLYSLVGEIQFVSGKDEPEQGDTITGATSGSTAIIHRTELRSGAWANGTAGGVLYIVNETGAFDASENINNTTQSVTSAIKSDGQTHTSQADVLKSSLVSYEDIDLATLWRSSRDGWQRVETGWEVRFTEGQNAPPIIDIGGKITELVQVATDTGWKSAASLYVQSTAHTAPWSGMTPSNIAAVDGVNATFTNTYQASSSVSLKNFGFNLKPSDTIMGIEVQMDAKRVTGTSDATWSAALGKFPGSGPTFTRLAPGRSSYPLAPINSTTMTAHILGSPTDNWSDGTKEIVSADVNSTNFGVRFNVVSWGFSAASYAVDAVRIKLHYLPAAAKVYLWDGSNDVASAVLTQDYVSKGTYAGSDAEGIYTLSDLTAYNFGAGIEIRTMAGGGGVLVAKTAAGPTRNYLPGSQLLTENNSKYQLMTENFYASTDLNALWGASGAGPAFSYDGTYFRRVRTGMLESKDKPRHIGAFQFKLVLGYQWGEASLSVAGKPLSFDGVLNASSFGFGHAITGMKQLNGQTFGVFTNGGVFGLSVSGGGVEQKLLIPDSKVIEYSVQHFGNDTIYMDQNGVRTTATTEKYGDFEGGTLSDNVNKWLRPRLRGVHGVDPRDVSFCNSTIIRSKGQYRMYFADGYSLTMSWDQKSEPEFTLQRPQLDAGAADKYLKVLSTSSDIDPDGKEYVFFSAAENPRDLYPLPKAWGFLYRSDVGSTWDGQSFPVGITISWVNMGDSTYNKRFTKWQLYGEAYNYSKTGVSFEPDLGDPASSSTPEQVILGNPDADATLDTKPFFATLRSTERGRNIAIRFSGTSDLIFPHTLQLLVSVNESKLRTQT